MTRSGSLRNMFDLFDEMTIMSSFFISNKKSFLESLTGIKTINQMSMITSLDLYLSSQHLSGIRNSYIVEYVSSSKYAANTTLIYFCFRSMNQLDL